MSESMSQKCLLCHKIDTLLNLFPIIFSVKLFKDNICSWCFSITENMRNYNSVLAVTINLNNPHYIDEIFYIPTKQFWISNFIYFSQEDGLYSNSLVSGKLIEEKIQITIDEINYILNTA